MARTLRYLRIAFSATCLIACGLMLAALSRSNRSADIVRGKLLIPYELISVRGRLKFTRLDYSPSPGAPLVLSYPVREDAVPVGENAAHTIENHVLHYSNDQGFGLYARHSIMFPHWFAAVLTAMLAGVPWIRRRFSLRTLLIATTLVAVGLGTIFALSR
jgi:hypothetical protein